MYWTLITSLLTALVMYIYFNFKYKKLNQLFLLKKEALEQLRGKYKYLVIKNNTLERTYNDTTQKLKYEEKNNKKLTKQSSEDVKKHNVLQAKIDLLESHKVKANNEALVHKEISKKLKDLQLSYMQLHQNYTLLKKKYDKKTKLK